MASNATFFDELGRPIPTESAEAHLGSLDRAYVMSIIVLTSSALVLLMCDRKCKQPCRALSCEPPGWDLRYLIPYAVCVAADWLQGPYVYDLYASFGYDRSTINALFIVGFLSAMVTGPLVGGIADVTGKRLMILLGYCVVYSLSSLTKHFGSDLGILFLGRVLGGTATSVLFTCFEAWMVAEYRSRGNEVHIGEALARMQTVNAFVAVLIGPLAQVGADSTSLARAGAWGELVAFYVGGDLVPFDMSIAFLLVGAVLVRALWREHRVAANAQALDAKQTRDAEQTLDVKQPLDAEQPEAVASSTAGCGARVCPGVLPAVAWLAGQPTALLLMAGSACTEASMYLFVIEWTPVLTTEHTRPMHGLVFAALMLSFMQGASLVALSAAQTAPSASLVFVCALGAVATTVVAVLQLVFDSADAPIQATFSTFVALCVFEATLGAYYALVGAVKAREVPERFRAAVYGTFRVPLNLLVAGLQLVSVSSAMTFATCAALVSVAVVFFAWAHVLIARQKARGDGAAPPPTEKSPLVAS